ncbi:DUF6708 domain-containing protein, partial [Gilliamella bombi]|uniref:DUF6708 domain-containing protein n=1 Tax=Gilliamella bombi TaxID=1908521 RepID=UPI001ABF74A1
MPSKYQPQISAWREDLHKGIYTTQLHLSNNKKLRYANDDYCEFSRSFTGMRFFFRLVTIFFSLIVILFLIFALYLTLPSVLRGTKHEMLLLMCCFIGFFLIYFFFQMFLSVIFAPEDCPIRLNRKTGKVYIYDHFILYFGLWEIFTRSPFRAKEISVKEFNWADIQGCMTSVSVPLASGGMVRSYRLECVV